MADIIYVHRGIVNRSVTKGVIVIHIVNPLTGAIFDDGRAPFTKNSYEPWRIAPLIRVLRELNSAKLAEYSRPLAWVLRGLRIVFYIFDEFVVGRKEPSRQNPLLP